jgi:hypothetical protein
MPDELAEGVLYVSLPYTTTIHLCACGCRTKVVSTLSPTDYELTFDGETISIWPSIGNWDFYCRSHYFIRHGRVQWAPTMSEDAIAAGRRRDRLAKEASTQRFNEPTELTRAGMPPTSTPDIERRVPVWRQVIRAIKSTFG